VGQERPWWRTARPTLHDGGAQPMVEQNSQVNRAGVLVDVATKWSAPMAIYASSQPLWKRSTAAILDFFLAATVFGLLLY
jgi:hypothetical protein